MTRATRKWQSIETAPTDGTLVLLYNGIIQIHNWSLYHVYNAPKFTHWMPLPSPPETIDV